jgi:hypothetical protein
MRMRMLPQVHREIRVLIVTEKERYKAEKNNATHTYTHLFTRSPDLHKIFHSASRTSLDASLSPEEEVLGCSAAVALVVSTTSA